MRLGWGWEPRGTWTGPVCRPGVHGQSLPGQLWAREVADTDTFGQGKSGPAARGSCRKLCICARVPDCGIRVAFSPKNKSLDR